MSVSDKLHTRLYREDQILSAFDPIVDPNGTVAPKAPILDGAHYIVDMLANSQENKVSAAFKSARQITIINSKNYDRAVNVLTVAAIYPILKLAITLIAGAAVTLTPLNIALIAIAAIYLLITIAFLVKYSPTASNCMKIFLRNLFFIAAAPVTGPHLIVENIYDRIRSAIGKRRARLQLEAYEKSDRELTINPGHKRVDTHESVNTVKYENLFV